MYERNRITIEMGKRNRKLAVFGSSNNGKMHELNEQLTRRDKSINGIQFNNTRLTLL